MLIRVLLCSLVLAANATAQAPVPNPAASGSIDGKVISNAGAPVRRAIVTVQGGVTIPPDLDPRAASSTSTIQQLFANRKSFSVETGEEGKFSFPAVDAGNYTMIVTRNGYIPHQRQMAVIAGSKVSGLSVTLIVQSIIEGRTLDEYGDPVPEAQVNVYRRNYSVNEGWTLGLVKSANSGADGRYSIGELEAGRYYVSATDPRSKGVSLRASAFGGTVQQEHKPEYVTTYYPAATSPASAAPVDVPASSEARGIDIRIQRSVVYRVRGKVAFDGPLTTGSVFLTPAGPGGVSPGALLTLTTGSVRPDDGTFQFLSVQPGAYNLRYSSGSNVPMLVGWLPVNVVDNDVEDLVLRIIPAGEMRGRLRMDTNGTQPSDSGTPASKPEVLLASVETFGAASARSFANPDGSFVLRPVGPGDYRVYVNPIPAGIYLRSVRYGSQDVTDRKFTLGYGGMDELEVVLAGGAATVQGELRDDKGAPVTAGQIIVWSEANPALNRFVAIDSERPGTFQISGLPPGDYRVLAFEVPGPFPDSVMGSPEFLTGFSGQATSVKLGGGDTQTVQSAMVPKGAVTEAVAKLR